MKRKEYTNFLTSILIADKLNDRKYYAREVTLDSGTIHPKRIDVMQFSPKGVIYTSDIEKGSFICYEIKSCRQDIYSGNGLNFYGEKNYIVTTMETYIKMQADFRDGRFLRFLKEKFPLSSTYYGVMVPVPRRIDLKDTDSLYSQFENPSELNGNVDDWKLWTAIPCREGPRNRSTTELLFCMLRSKHSYTNNSND